MKLRPLRSTGVTPLHHYYGPLRHLARPGSAPHGAMVDGHAPSPPRLPVLRLIPCVDMPAPIPRRNPGLRIAHFSQDGGLPRFDIGSASTTVFRGLLGVHSRSGLPTRRAANAAPCIKGFRGLVTSSTTPIATGWSDPCQAGLAPAENQAPFHGARQRPGSLDRAAWGAM